MTNEMFGDTGQKNSLALELTEMGLSLFVCDGDEPIECVAHVDLEDPDFSQKLAGFRTKAEQSVGKGFATDIWLPDEQVMFRSLKLDEEEADDLRLAASSALSASTPFQGSELCFDLGDTNGAGYTPVAAIPKDKMDEAMSFANKMRMNPRSITTSNVVAGFSERPEFQPYVASAKERTPIARVAVLAMLLATPIFLMSGEIGKQRDQGASLASALVATVGGIAAQTTVPDVKFSSANELARVGLPSLPTSNVLSRAIPQLASASTSRATDENFALNAGLNDRTISSLGEGLEMPVEEISMVDFPSTGNDFGANRSPMASLSSTTQVEVVETVDVHAQTDVLFPTNPIAPESNFAVSGAGWSHRIVTAKPLEMFESGPDKLPSLDMLTVSYVQNVFDGNIEIHDLVASDDETAGTLPSHDLNPTFVQVANVGGDFPVARPAARAAPRLVQPAFMPRPEPRSRNGTPRLLMDFSGLGPLDRLMTAEDPPPIVSGSTEQSPTLKRPSALSVVIDRPTAAIMERAHFMRREIAKVAASQNKNGPLATLNSPRARTAVPLAGLKGAIVQVLVPKIFANVQQVLTASVPETDANGVQATQPLQFARLMVSQPRLPDGVPRTKSTIPTVGQVATYRPGTVLHKRSLILANLARNPRVPRPPMRRVQSDSAAALDPVIEAIRAELLSQTPNLVDTDTVSAQEDVAALVPTRTEPANGSPDLPSTASATVPSIAPPALARVAALVQDGETSPILRQSTQPRQAAEPAAATPPDLKLRRPPSRPRTVVKKSERATQAPEATTDIAALINNLEPARPTGPISKYAVDSIDSPARRPASLQGKAKKIRADRNNVAKQVAKKQEPVSSTPKERLRIPSGARVASTATIKDAIALGDISLIGIYGTTKTRRALVRLPQGRYVQISRGDNVSGWTVSAVGDDAVRIQKGRKNKVLRLPN